MNESLTNILGDEHQPFLKAVRLSVYSVFLYLNIEMDMMQVLSYLIIFDMALGIGKSLRLGVRFEFKILMWGFMSKIALLMIPLTVALMGKPFGKDFVWTVDIAIKLLIVNEGFSVLANALSIKNNKNIENFDFITLTVNYATELFKKKIKNFFDDK